MFPVLAMCLGHGVIHATLPDVITHHANGLEQRVCLLTEQLARC